MNLLQIEPGLLIWTIITFVVLLFILWKWAWKPIVEALDSRAERIRSDIDNAEQAKDDAMDLLSKHRKMMETANQEAADIIAQGKQDAEKIKNDIIEKARSEAIVIADRSRKEIELAKEQAMKELQDNIVSISTDIAAKIIGKNLDPGDQKDFVNKAIDKLDTVQ